SPAVPNDLDTLCAVTLGPHDDGPHSPGELVRELEPWGAVDGAAIYDALDATTRHVTLPSGPWAGAGRHGGPGGPGGGGLGGGGRGGGRCGGRGGRPRPPPGRRLAGGRRAAPAGPTGQRSAGRAARPPAGGARAADRRGRRAPARRPAAGRAACGGSPRRQPA